MVSSTPRPHFTLGKDPVPIVQEDRWTPGSVWTGGKSRPHRDSIPDRPARSQSLYRLSYPAHTHTHTHTHTYIYIFRRSARYFCPMLTKYGISQQIVIGVSQHPVGAELIYAVGLTDGQTHFGAKIPFSWAGIATCHKLDGPRNES